MPTYLPTYAVRKLSHRVGGKVGGTEWDRVRQGKSNQIILRASPSEVNVDLIVPAGNSIAELALKYIDVRRQGLKQGIAFITRLALFIKITSMEKRIKKVCIDLQGEIIKASPSSKDFRDNRPIVLFKRLCAVKALSASITPLVLLEIIIRRD